MSSWLKKLWGQGRKFSLSLSLLSPSSRGRERGRGKEREREKRKRKRERETWTVSRNWQQSDWIQTSIPNRIIPFFLYQIFFSLSLSILFLTLILSLLRSALFFFPLLFFLSSNTCFINKISRLKNGSLTNQINKKKRFTTQKDFSLLLSFFLSLALSLSRERREGKRRKMDGKKNDLSLSGLKSHTWLGFTNWNLWERRKGEKRVNELLENKNH